MKINLSKAAEVPCIFAKRYVITIYYTDHFSLAYLTTEQVRQP